MHIYSFFLFFHSFSLKIFVSFIFIVLFPSWHLALVLFSSLCFSQFSSGRHKFWFPLFAGSIYYTLFLLDCFDFAYGCICIYACIFSHSFCCCYKPLPLHWAFAVLWSFPFFSFSLSSSFFPLLFHNFNLKIFKPIMFFYIYCFVCLSYCSFPCS